MNNDLISREALKEVIEQGSYDAFEYLWDAVRKAIDNAPTINEKRPKGEWKTNEGYDGDEYYECSNCGEPWVLTAGTPKDNNMNFGPNCGADMRGGNE